MFRAIILYLIAIILVCKLSEAISPNSSRDMYKVHIDAQQSSRMQIERQEIQRELRGEQPLSDKELESIAAESVRKALLK